jgi:anaerobic magnesium-protoporphyrin IX monomethyl ester cyclase
MGREVRGKFMRVLFIYAGCGQLRVAENVELEIGALVPPLGLLYLARMLQLQGHHVQVIDATAEKNPTDAIHRALNGVDAVGMTIYSGIRGRTVSMRYAQTIKDRDPELPLILGGPHLSVYPKEALVEHQAQVGVQGEGEYRIASIIDAVTGKGSYETIPGIIYHDQNGFRQTQPYPQIKELDALPFPARDLVRQYDYGYSAGVKLIPGAATSMMTSRGCPFHCRFCQQSVFTPQYRSHSAPRIISEIDDVVTQGYTSIAFADDTFLANKKRTMEVMNHIISQGYDLKLWIMNARVDSADRELYETLRKAGVEHIIFGVEFGTQPILDYYNKNITLDQARDAITLSHDMGFFTSANFILGAPIETHEQIRQTIAFAQSLPIDNAFFRELGYGAQAPLWLEAVQQGKIKPDEDFATGGSERDLGPFTSDEIQHICEHAYFSIILNPKYWIRELRYSLQHNNPQFLKMGTRMLLQNLHTQPHPTTR